MASGSSSRISCGVRQFFDLYPSVPSIQKVGLKNINEGLLLDLMRDYNRWANRQGREHGYAQVVFSDADHIFGHQAGKKFAAFLKKRFPRSKLVSLGATRSPSTGNDITTWIWTIPHARFTADKLYPNIKMRRQPWERVWHDPI